MEVTKINHVCSVCDNMDFQKARFQRFFDNCPDDHIDNIEVHKVYPPSNIKKILKVHTDDTLVQQIMNHLTFFRDDQDMFNDECYEYVFTITDMHEIMDNLDIEYNGFEDYYPWLPLDRNNKIYITFVRTEDMVNLCVCGQVIIGWNQVNDLYKENIHMMKYNTFRCDDAIQSYWLNPEITDRNDFKRYVTFNTVDMRLIMYFRSEHEPDMKSGCERMKAFYEKYRIRHPKWKMIWSKKRKSSSTSCHEVCFYLSTSNIVKNMYS